MEACDGEYLPVAIMVIIPGHQPMPVFEEFPFQVDLRQGLGTLLDHDHGPVTLVVHRHYLFRDAVSVQVIIYHPSVIGIGLGRKDFYRVPGK